MITLEHISKSYSHQGIEIPALRDINLNITAGTTLGIIGSSGAGKSTLLRMLNLLERPDQGKIILENQNLLDQTPTQLRNIRKKIGMIFQHFHLLSRRTVSKNIALPLELINTEKSIIQRRISELLKLVGLEDKREAYPGQLSGGQKQRVAIARALATEPTILLCDEATSALDPQTTNSILELLSDIKNKLNLTIILITHEMDVIKKIADEVVVLEKGCIVEKNDVISIFTKPQHPLTEEFVRANLKSHLPNTLMPFIAEKPEGKDQVVLRLTFRGNAAKEAIIHEVGKKFQLSINILQANLEIIKNHSIGVMLITLPFEASIFEKINRFFVEKNLTQEIIGYVNSRDLADR